MFIAEYIQAYQVLNHFRKHLRKLESPEDWKDLVLSIFRVSLSFLCIFLLTLIIYVFTLVPSRWGKLGICFFHKEINGWLLFAFMMTFFAAYILIYGIKSIEKLKSEEDLINRKFNDKISNIYTQIISTVSLLGNKFEDSFKYFSNSVNIKYTDYEGFIKEFKNYANLNIHPLSNIADKANDSKNGKFLCVIAYDKYFNKGADEIKEMVQYFARYYKITNQNDNIVKRIFTLPGEGMVGGVNTIKLTDEYLDKPYITLQYLIINEVCGVDTYLLVYQDGDHTMHEKILLKTDYVIAYHSFSDCRENYSELYFAFPEEENTSSAPLSRNNRAIKTCDTFFLKVFEQDFRNRMDLKKDDTTPTTMIRFNRDNYELILRALKLDASTKDKVCQKITDIKSWIEEYAHLDNKEHIITSIDTWKKKVNGT